MLPFEAPTIFEQLPRFLFNAPKVVADQKSKFESDEQFRRMSRECEVMRLECSFCRHTILSSFTMAGYLRPSTCRPFAGLRAVSVKWPAFFFNPSHTYFFFFLLSDNYRLYDYFADSLHGL